VHQRDHRFDRLCLDLARGLRRPAG
jgi:hypothetical protein